MTFRVRIISPLKATEADLARRQQRYSEFAGPETAVTVENLAGGPPALNSSGDVLASAAAIYQQGLARNRLKYDAILVDCVFDPAVDELQEATGRTTLPLIPLVAESFAVIARSTRQCELLAELVDEAGYGDWLCAVLALDISYEEAKQPSLFNRVMRDRLETAVFQDGARAVMFGSTTMAITDEMRQTAGNIPLFMPGMVALRVMEQLWRDRLWPGPGDHDNN